MKFPLTGFQQMLRSLRKWIVGLNPRRSRPTIWLDYATQHGYADDEVRHKVAFVREFMETTRPPIVWDIGCNTGEYSAIALRSGAGAVIGFEFDHGALDAAYHRAEKEELPLLPLYLDAANPSPSEGWNERERKGLRARGPADAILALALVHHLAIGRNVPLARVVDWLIDLAPRGVIEFVPKSDPAVVGMLRLREDVFADYSEENFLASIRRRAAVVKAERVTATERLLVSYGPK